MNNPESDEELGRTLRALAVELRHSPAALLSLARSVVEHQNKSVFPDFAPFPKCLTEETITANHLHQWPNWTSQLIQPGCKMDQLLWPDGTTTVRLLSPRDLVLAAAIGNKPKHTRAEGQEAEGSRLEIGN